MMNKLPTSVNFYREKAKLGVPHKVLYTGLAVVFVVIGIAGLIIPVIPGLLFIVGAVFLLSKVSTRVQRWSEGQSWMSAVRVRMIQLGGLKPLAKARFLALLAVKSVVSGIEQTADSIRRFLRR